MTPQDRLEEELKQALRRDPAPDGFAERVLVRVKAQAARESWWRRVMRTWHFPAMRYATVAVVVIAMVVGGIEYRQYENERRAGEAARKQVLLALRIASKKLQYAQAKVHEVGGNPPLRRKSDIRNDRGGESPR